MGKSLKINYLFNLANTVSGLLFPLITFPYASRILLADGIGQVNFFQSIIQYITLLSCLGIPMYAVREVARVRDNIEERNRISLEILLLHATLTILGYILVAILTATISEIQIDIPLFLLLSTSIFFTSIGCEWFYQGIEDFKYITIRSLIVRTISVVLLLLLVKTKDDIMWYGAYSVFGVLGGNIFNFLRLRKYISVKEFSINNLKPFRHLKPALQIFALNLIISIYIQLNTIMLGFITDNKSVGLYTAAYKLVGIVISIVNALGTVMIPKLSNLIATGQITQFAILSQKAMQFVIAISLPMSAGMILTAPYLIHLFCGETYAPAKYTLQIIAPIIIVIGIAYVVGYQILYPQGKEKIIIQSTAIGAIANFLLNLWLIPRYAHNGAAISTIMTESIVTISMISFGSKYIPIQWKNKHYLHYTIGTTLMIIGIWGLEYSSSSSIVNLLLSCSIGIIIYTIYLISIKDSFYLEIKNIIAQKTKEYYDLHKR